MYVTLFTLHHYSSCMLHMSLLSVFIRSYSRRYRQLLTTFMYLYACYYIPIYTICMLSYDSNIPCYMHGWLTSHWATCWLLASYDTCYYMLSHYIIYIYATVLSYSIILLLLLLYLYIYKQLHGNDDMNLCKSYFIYDIVTHINSSILNHFLN